MIKYAWLLLLLGSVISHPIAASVILGTGNAGLLGGDLTDPEDDGDDALSPSGVNFNATFTTNAGSASFAPGNGERHGILDVFDNKVVLGEGKWCCEGPGSGPLHLTAEFSQAIVLTHFTITSANDVPDRDPFNWKIQGSNDGQNFTDIFTHSGSSVWSERHQTILFDAGNFANQGNVSSDFALPEAFRFIRYQVSSTVNNSSGHQLAEIEYFSSTSTSSEPSPTAIPEPDSFLLLVFSGIIVLWSKLAGDGLKKAEIRP